MLSVNDISGYVRSANNELLPVIHAIISAASNGDNTLVAAVPGKKIRVISLFLIASGLVTITFKSSTTTAKTGSLPLIAQVGMVLPKNEDGWFETNAGELLNLNLSSATGVYGALNYVEIL
jgi:hypothetical protein